MRNNFLDYDKIAPDYNCRYQNNTPQGTLSALRRILSQKAPQRVLEVGCGTCHWLASLSGANQASFLGIDKAREMLKQSEKLQDLPLFQAVAEIIPLKSNSFDFIYCVNALHHFSNPEQFIFEAARILKPSGVLAIIGMEPRDTHNSWYIYDFFAGTLARDLARFPNWPQVEDWLKKANFTNIHLQDVDFIHDPKTNENVLDDPFLQKNACSQLALLSHREYQAGLDKLREHAKSKTKSGFRYETDILISMLQAERS